METTTIVYESGSGWSRSFPSTEGKKTLVLVLGASAFRDAQGPIEELLAAYPDATVVGCSTAGEIAGTRIADGTLSVAVIRFDRTDLRLATAKVGCLDASGAAGESIGRVLATPDLRGVFVLSDGLGVNGSELVRSLQAAVGPDVIVTGGLAADGSRFLHTWVVANGPPTERIVAAVGFYGDSIRVGHGSRGGWDIFGPQRRVTRSKGSVLYELDGEPALRLYRKYLGDRADGLPATALLFPLALRATTTADKTLVRTVLAVDEAEQSLTFAGDVPEGAHVQLMRANFDRLIDGAADAGRATAEPWTGPSVAIAISCVGRRLVLGERTEEEVEATARAFPSNTPLLGFYSYGEISPYCKGAPCDLHNQTMTVTRLGEM